MFELNKKVNNVGSIYRLKSNKEFYIKIDADKYVRLIDNYDYTIPEEGIELWTLIK